jgi:hypothetical protein
VPGCEKLVPMRPVRAYQYQTPGYGYGPAGYDDEPAYAPRMRTHRVRHVIGTVPGPGPVGGAGEVAGGRRRAGL